MSTRSRSAAISGAIILSLAAAALTAGPASGDTTITAMPGWVAGTVVDATTLEPISGVTVSISPVGTPARSNYSPWPGGGFTDPLGNFAINNVPPGEYKIFFDPIPHTLPPTTTTYASTWYPNAQFIEGADVLTVSEDAVTVVNGQLSLAGLISGTLSPSPPVGNGGIVSAYAFNGITDSWVRQATTPLASGAFTLQGLKGGVEYRLWAQTSIATPSDTSYWSTYYDEVSEVDDATGVTAGVGTHLQGVSISMPEHPTIPTRRIAGTDRFATSAMVSGEFESADIAFIASGLDFPDALSAAPVAAELGGPVLLTHPDALSAPVIAELERLNPSTVVIVGSFGSVSSAVATQIEELLGVVPERVAGANRYETSRALARYGFPNYVREVYIATGKNFPDALSAGALAGSGGFPLILVDGQATSVDEATKTLIRELAPKDATILGLSGSVSEGIRTSLNTMEWPRPFVNREGWGNRYLTSMYLSMGFYRERPAEKLYLALGTKFPDALAGAALAGTQDAPLVIIKGDCVPFQVMQFIYGLGPEEVVLLGGPAGLSPAIDNLTVCAG